jgi:hypothetical protein
MRTDGQTDGHVEANSRFLQFCECAQGTGYICKAEGLVSIKDVVILSSFSLCAVLSLQHENYEMSYCTVSENASPLSGSNFRLCVCVTVHEISIVAITVSEMKYR